MSTRTAFMRLLWGLDLWLKRQKNRKARRADPSTLSGSASGSCVNINVLARSWHLRAQIMKAGFILALALVVPLVGASAVAAGPVSGKVQILEEEGKLRPVVGELLVYIEGVEAPLLEPQRPRTPTLASKNKSFEPHVQAVPVGTAVSFPNFDDIMHNVFSLTKGNRFDLGLYKSGAKKDYVFETPGLVRVYCNIHPQMSAFVLVMDSPYYTWAGADGSFRIDDVPPGQLYRQALARGGRVGSQPIMVTEQGAAGLGSQLDVVGLQEAPSSQQVRQAVQEETWQVLAGLWSRLSLPAKIFVLVAASRRWPHAARCCSSRSSARTRSRRSPSPRRSPAPASSTRTSRPTASRSSRSSTRSSWRAPTSRPPSPRWTKRRRSIRPATWSNRSEAIS